MMGITKRTPVDPLFRSDVLAGLSAPARAVPARWLYDRRGSELFEAITALPEYYLTRTETELLERHSPTVAGIVGSGHAVVEFGSGSSTKTRILLRAMDAAIYVPIDISGEFLRDAGDALASEFPHLGIHEVEADFMRSIMLPPEVQRSTKLGFFPGSTIGNMVASTAVDLLRSMKGSLGVGAHLLIGVDRIKDQDVLIRAYDDPAGVTAAFNLNLLHRINRELGADIDVEAFAHKAIWNDRMSRIEMHLEVGRDVAFTVDGVSFEMKAGETIHTENSHKYGPRDARLLLRAGGWGIVAEWTDPDDYYALILAEAEAPRQAP